MKNWFLRNENTYSVMSVVFEVVRPTNSKDSFLLAEDFLKWSLAKGFVQELSPLQDVILAISFATVLSTFSPISK